MEEENTPADQDSQQFLRQMAAKYFEDLLEYSAQSIRVVGL
jgi:hypothetical protein